MAKIIAMSKEGHLLRTRLIASVIANVVTATNNVGICVSFNAKGKATKRSIKPAGNVLMPKTLLI